MTTEKKGNPNYGPMLDPLDYNAECRSVALELNDFATIRFNYRGGSLEWLCNHEEAQAFRPGEFYTFKFEKVTK